MFTKVVELNVCEIMDTLLHEHMEGSDRNYSPKRRGFASLDKDTRRRIASLGGRAAHQKGTAHRFTSDEAREAGRRGGLAISKNREHMSAIGRKGGLS